MNCPRCGHKHATVIDSRGQTLTIRRRRKCLGCGGRWTTFEVPAEVFYVARRNLVSGRLEKLHGAMAAMMKELTLLSQQEEETITGMEGMERFYLDVRGGSRKQKQAGSNL